MKLLKKEKDCRKKLDDFVVSSEYSILNDNSMKYEDFLRDQWEKAVCKRMAYENKVLSKPFKKANKKGIKHYGKEKI